jgi:hypothetical protein
LEALEQLAAQVADRKTWKRILYSFGLTPSRTASKKHAATHRGRRQRRI